MFLSKEQFGNFKLGVAVWYMRKDCVRLLARQLCSHSLAVLVINPFKVNTFFIYSPKTVQKVLVF